MFAKCIFMIWSIIFEFTFVVIWDKISLGIFWQIKTLMIIDFACGSFSITLHYTKPYFCVFYLPYISLFFILATIVFKIRRRCKLYHNEIEYWTLMTYVASLTCKLGIVLLSVKAILISVSCNIVCTSTEIPNHE